MKQNNYSIENLNLQNLQLIYKSKRSQVYKGNHKDERPVVLKLMALDAPSVYEQAQLKQEHDILVRLDHEGIIKSHGISTIGQRSALVLEDFGGISLAQILSEKTLTLDLALNLATKICQALAVLHQNNIIHKDINPSNIVWNEISGEVKIIDFNIATTLNREIVEFESLSFLEGTLPYISPEQTGRMNRAVDYRSDLYSLGATLYHLFTNRYPFEAKDEMGFIHSHIAKEPTSLTEINPKLPAVLSEIVLKLIAKNTEDRYQSALGLKKDLERCFREWQETKSISPFVIAENDVPSKFRLPQKIYGREKEVRELLSSFERVNKTGQAEIFLITGYAGVGKTTLVQEVHKPITASRGYFIAGKFDQLQRDIPYRALVQAFESLTKQILSESAKELDDWKEKLLDVLDSNAGVITEIIPSLEGIIGKQPTALKLPPEQTKNRFNLLFQNFIKVMAQPQHPLTIFLDDLQWADDASLSLIEQIYLRSDDKSLLLIGAYRDNEVSPAHSLNSTFKQVEENKAIINTVDLKPLKVEDLEVMLVDASYAEEKKVKPLAKLLEKKTQGNPYFVGEFLKELYLKEIIYFANYSWQWDIDQIEKWGFTDNIVELMVSKIEALPTDTKNLLTRSACIGSTFNLATLATVTQKDQAEVLVGLQSALTQDLLLRRKEVYTFAHDRVQEAAYALIPDADKQRVHLEIGKYLLAETSEASLEKNIFNIVDQINAGLALITIKQEKDQLAELNLLAGKRAKVSAAYQPALNYLLIAIKLLGDNPWDRHYALSLSIHEEAAEFAGFNRNHELVDSLFKTTVQNTKMVLDKVNVYKTCIHTYVNQSKTQQAVEFSRDILEQLGVYLPAKPNRWHFIKAFCKVWFLLRGKSLDNIANLPKASNAKAIAAMSVCDLLYAAAGIEGNPVIWIIAAQKQIELQLKYGNYSAFSYIAWGLVLIMGNRIQKGYQFAELSIKLGLNRGTDLTYSELEKSLKTFKDSVGKGFYGQLYTYCGICMPWKKGAKEAVESLLQAYQLALQNGNFEVAKLSIGTHYLYRFFMGDNLAELEHGCQSNNLIGLRLQNASLGESYFYLTWQASLNLLKETKNPLEFTGSVCNEADPFWANLSKADTGVGSCCCLMKLVLACIFCKYSQAIVFANHYEGYRNFTSFGTAVANFYASLTRLALFEETKQSKLLAKVVKNQKQMKLWAKHAPINFLNKWHLVEAERCRILGQNSKAHKHYQKAIKEARKSGFLTEEALALELFAKFFLKNDEGLAGYYMREAYAAYARWGAVTKLKHLKDNYSHLLISSFSNYEVLSNDEVLASIYTTSTQKDSSTLDVHSLMQSTRALTSEIQTEKLIGKLMNILIENAGASLGALLLPKDQPNSWIIAAYEEVDSENILKEEVYLENATKLLPVALINYVIRSQEEVILSDAAKDNDYQQDPYILAKAPKSIMGLPLLYQGKLVGVAYLENSLTNNVFDLNKTEVLKLLSSQAAISLHNASLVKELKLSRQRVNQAAEQVRQKIAEDMHGGLQTKLFKVWHKLSQLTNRAESGNNVRTELEESCAELENIREKEVRGLSHRLHPLNVKIGLMVAIYSLLDNFPKSIKLNLKVDEAIETLDDLQSNEFPMELRLNIYRILEEALLNVQKHADASLVNIVIAQKESNIYLKVRDNGKGFNVSTVTRGLGLHSIEDRVDLLEGKWYLESFSGKGTTLEVYLPLKQNV